MDIGEKIKYLRIKNELTQEEIAIAADTTKQTIHKYETGIISNIPAGKVKAIADKLQTTPGYLMGWEEASVEDKLKPPSITDDVVSIPVIGEIAAGYDSLAVEDWSGESIEIPRYFLKGRKQEEFFFLRVKGDSMFPEYRAGDMVLILRQETLNYSGQVGAVLYGHENATLKKVEFVPGEDWMNLVAINPTVPPMRIEGPDLEQCRILGIPKYLIREYE